MRKMEENDPINEVATEIDFVHVYKMVKKIFYILMGKYSKKSSELTNFVVVKDRTHRYLKIKYQSRKFGLTMRRKKNWTGATFYCLYKYVIFI